MNKHQMKLAKLYAELIGYEVIHARQGITVTSAHKTIYDFNPFQGQLQLDARELFEVTVEYCDGVHVSAWNWSKKARTLLIKCKNSNASEMVIECILRSQEI